MTNEFMRRRTTPHGADWDEQGRSARKAFEPQPAQFITLAHLAHSNLPYDDAYVARGGSPTMELLCLSAFFVSEKLIWPTNPNILNNNKIVASIVHKNPVLYTRTCNICDTAPTLIGSSSSPSASTAVFQHESVCSFISLCITIVSNEVFVSQPNSPDGPVSSLWVLTANVQ